MKKGLDISKWNLGLNFAKVKAQGYDFIIPRDGWSTETDPQLLTFVNGAKANGLEIPGVYHFIYAINKEEVIQNAQAAIANVQKVGLPKSTVIWCDWEYDSVDKAKDRGVVITDAMQKSFVCTFCDYILAQGYPTGVYVNQDYMARVFGKDFGKKYDLWLSDLEGEAAYECVYRQTRYSKVGDIQVDVDEYYGQYTAGTAKPKKKEDTMAKPKSKDYVNGALLLLARKLAYKNQFPYNCGLLDDNGVTWGDCWNVNPKTMAWSMYCNMPVWANKIKGSAHVSEVVQKGMKASGLPDVTGDVIMAKYCTKTTFKKMLQDKKAPCLLLINGSHMGAYIGDFDMDGKTYNVSEFSPNSKLASKMRSYVNEYGQRLTHKGGTVIGTWNQCGYLTAFLDYSDWEEKVPAPVPKPAPAPAQPTISDGDLAVEILRGKWGNNPTRQEKITAKYGAAKYKAAQAKVDSIMSALNWYRIEVKLADEILSNQWGNNPARQTSITLKYGANAYRIAQGFVNDIAGSRSYTIKDLQTAYQVANDIIFGVYGDGESRKALVDKKFGSTVRGLAQEMVNDITK